MKIGEVKFLCVPSEKSGLPVFPISASSEKEAWKFIKEGFPGGRLFQEITLTHHDNGERRVPPDLAEK